MRQTNKAWLYPAVVATILLAIAAIPYFRWAIFVVSEPISNPLWPNKALMFWDGIGFGLLFLIVRLWWCTIPTAVLLAFAWTRAFRRPKELGANQRLDATGNNAAGSLRALNS